MSMISQNSSSVRIHNNNGLPPDERARLKDLLREAVSLEKQLRDIHQQQALLLRNAETRRGARNSEVEEEIISLRDGLKEVYEEIILADLATATAQNIEERLWRNVFYAYIEEIRTKLRKNKDTLEQSRLSTTPGAVNSEYLVMDLNRHLDIGVGFYQEMIQLMKVGYGIDLDTVGLDLFKESTQSKPSSLLLPTTTIQRSLIFLGDLARYREIVKQEDGHSAENVNEGGSNSLGSHKKWDIARGFYTRAAKVMRESGKPFSQLALLSTFTSEDLDAVYFYCLSTSMKFPSSVGRDNLRAFYAKLKFDESNDDITDAYLDKIFLQMHRAIMGGMDIGSESLNTSKQPSFPSPPTFSILESALTTYLSTLPSYQNGAIDSTISSPASLSNFTKMLIIVICTAWEAGERARNPKISPAGRQTCRTAQYTCLLLGFALLVEVLTHATSTKDFMEAHFERLYLPPVALWCTYIFGNVDLVVQCYTMARKGDLGGGVVLELGGVGVVFLEKIQTFFRLLLELPPIAQRPTTTDATLHNLLKEDFALLGLMPLRKFHLDGIIWMEREGKEMGIIGELKNEKEESETHVRWERCRVCLVRCGNVEGLDFIRFNEIENKFILIDEESKKQSRAKSMRALATARLQSEVSDLETKFSRSHLSPTTVATLSKYPGGIVAIVDVSVLVEALTVLKKLVGREVPIIVELIVPLDVIDSLDRLKKGNAALNARAREAIRFLDQRFRTANNSGAAGSPATGGSIVVIRAQKISEKLTHWEDAQAYFASGITVTHIPAGSDDQRSNSISNVNVTTSPKGKKIIISRRRRSGFSGDESEGEGSGSGAVEVKLSDAEDDESEEDDDTFEDEDEGDDDDDDEVEEDKADAAGSDDLEKKTMPIQSNTEPILNDVPRRFRPILSCCLYRIANESATASSPKPTVILLCNDLELVSWAQMFNNRLEMMRAQQFETEICGQEKDNSGRRRGRRGDTGNGAGWAVGSGSSRGGKFGGSRGRR